jgi:RNA polymerase sigma-70 factor (ECF subfamily)
LSSTLARQSVPSAGQVAATARSFEAIYAEYFPFVWRCLRGLGVAGSGLDDAAQDVFVVVHRRLPDFRGDSNVKTWLYAIMRNVAANHRRGVSRKGHAEELDHQLPSVQPDPAEHAQDAEAAAFVATFLKGLDEKKRDVFVLAVLEELPIPEVSEMLEIPLNTAYTRLRSVRAAFRSALEAR